ncbi:hypothetical protein EVG20_g10020 [Dentipellis fragilis]|uniref:Uncharacterized protein n=1 Tax=Dentipellis fragilis TaxID=205917 RepID=A0A4Y9XV58_9AGAM|nr:hypothetical protein EVG20_g10020 [Dentipellis fragilis]
MWTTKVQLAYLNTHLDGYRAAQVDGTVSGLWPTIISGWFEKWPEDTEKVRQRIRSWYNNKTRGGRSGKSTTHRVLNLTPRKRKAAAWQVYQNLFWKPKLEAQIEPAYQVYLKTVPKGMTPEQPIAYRNRICAVLYADETEEVKATVKKDQVQRRHVDLANLDLSDAQRKLHEYEMNIDCLPLTARTLLRELEEQTGWVGIFDTEIGNITSFRDSYPNYHSHIEKPFVEYLKKVFPKQARMERALHTSDQESKELIGPATTSGSGDAVNVTGEVAVTHLDGDGKSGADEEEDNDDDDDDKDDDNAEEDIVQSRERRIAENKRLLEMLGINAIKQALKESGGHSIGGGRGEGAKQSTGGSEGVKQTGGNGGEGDRGAKDPEGGSKRDRPVRPHMISSKAKSSQPAQKRGTAALAEEESGDSAGTTVKDAEGPTNTTDNLRDIPDLTEDRQTSTRAVEDAGDETQRLEEDVGAEEAETAALPLDKEPEWMREAGVFLKTGSPSPEWAIITVLWATCEMQMGFPTAAADRKHWLDNTKRPFVMKQWIREGRKYRVVPALGNLSMFGDAWKQWWTTNQPKWRFQSDVDWPLKRDVDGDDNKWEVLAKGGGNGIFMLLVRLVWWYRSAKTEAEVNDVDSAIEDVQYALTKMALMLSKRPVPVEEEETDASASTSKARKGDKGKGSGKASGKRAGEEPSQEGRVLRKR